MLEPTACRFWQAALQSGLADAQTLQPCWDAVAPEKRAPEHIDRRLARQAVQAGVVTVWQAQQILAGRSTGFKLDRYVLLQLIGQGGMGRVYLARDTKLNRRVALKILSPERVNNPRAIARFHREAMVGAQLQHENLVRIYDEGESNGKCYLVMEYIEGKNIGQMIGEAGPLPPVIAARLARQVALGLEHAQRKGLIHRDVNPYNILVTHDGSAKLTDLGLAIDLGDADRVTRDGATVGTFDYVSPEQARHSHSVDTRSDIYSLGCTLYHMLTGKVPFPSASLPEKLFGHQVSEPEPMRNLAPGVPEGLAAVVVKTMKKAADDRYATPLELALALEPFADDVAGSEFASDHPTPPAVRVAVAPRAGGEAAVTQQFQSTIPTVPTVPTVPTALPTDVPEFDLGINLTAPVLSKPPPPPKPKPAAKAEAPEPAPPQVADEPLADDEPFNLGINLGAPTAATKRRQETGDSGKRSAGGVVVTLSPATIPAPPPLAAVNVGPSAEAGSDDGNFGVGLGVDLGPEPPLLKASAPTKAKVKAKAKADAAKPRTSARRPFWLLPALAGAGVLLLAAGAALAYRQFSGPPAKVAATQAGPTKEIKTVAVANVVAPRTKPAATRTDPEPQGKQVVVVASDGTRSVEADLKSAIRAAIGSRGHVLLLNREPLKFSAAEALRAAGGVLVIRAAEGVKPVLKVEVKGGAPFLSVRTDASLRIEGVTIEVTYVDPGNDPAAVIEAGGSVTLDRCAFRVVNPTVKSRAVAAESGALTATGCWFENFDRAIDVACFGGAASSLRHCMIVQTSGGDKTPGVSAVRLRSMPGGFSKTGRKLVLERCTIRNGGFLEFVGFAPTAPVSVTLTGNAVVADSLISWEPGTTPIGRESLVWTGRDDAYSVQSTTGWVNLVASKEAAPTPLPDGPKDLASWTKLVGDEIDPILPPLRFATEPSASSERLEPSAFAVTSSRTSRPHGADPAYVGPGATPLTTPAPALAVPPGRFGGR